MRMGKLTRLEEDLMSILAWIVLGLIAGFISSLIVNRHGEGFFLDIVIGVIGAIIGGLVVTALGGEGVSGFNLYSILVAVGGAIVLLVILHAIRGTPRAGSY
jgi:uncharacterized membrane protein YeaQ/YmgE (transglycosylase-associated protein family)